MKKVEGGGLAPWAALEARHSGRCDVGWAAGVGILGAGRSSSGSCAPPPWRWAVGSAGCGWEPPCPSFRGSRELALNELLAGNCSLGSGAS